MLVNHGVHGYQSFFMLVFCFGRKVGIWRTLRFWRFDGFRYEVDVGAIGQFNFNRLLYFSAMLTSTLVRRGITPSKKQALPPTRESLS